jgi:light-regulated signal transduction histidine kinase (bacteriophytochrome)
MNSDNTNREPTITAKNVDVSNCDREQIQFVGAILSHSVMLILREPEFTIVQVRQSSYRGDHQ